MPKLTVNKTTNSIGVLNPSLRVFDIIMRAEYGTSYNSYLIKGEKNSILVDSVHEKFSEEYFENIRGMVDIQTINYLIVNHTEPDHSGSIKYLLKINPNITIICTMAAKKYLQAQLNTEFLCQTVKHGEQLKLNEHELEFVVAPFLHWPDTMMVYHAAEKTLFSCDFFGAHFCEPRLFDSHIMYPERYAESFKYYFDCIFGPFKPFVLAGLDKIKDFQIETICTSHGPILRERIEISKQLYRQWSTPEKQTEKKKITIIYASAYGYTEKLAFAIKEKFESDFVVEAFDVVETPLSKMAGSIEQCDALFVGSCTINKDAPKDIWDVLSLIDAMNTGKPAGVFGDYGWSGEATPMINYRLKSLNFKTQEDVFKVVFSPTEEDFSNLIVYAQKVIDQIKK